MKFFLAGTEIFAFLYTGLKYLQTLAPKSSVSDFDERFAVTFFWFTTLFLLLGLILFLYTRNNKDQRVRSKSLVKYIWFISLIPSFIFLVYDSSPKEFKESFFEGRVIGVCGEGKKYPWAKDFGDGDQCYLSTLQCDKIKISSIKESCERASIYERSRTSAGYQTCFDLIDENNHEGWPRSNEGDFYNCLDSSIDISRISDGGTNRSTSNLRQNREGVFLVENVVISCGGKDPFFRDVCFLRFSYPASDDVCKNISEEYQDIKDFCYKRVKKFGE